MEITTQIISIGMPKSMLKSRDEFGKKITIPVFQETIEYWFEKMLGRHFKPWASQRYDYQSRAPQTVERKRGFAQVGNRDARLPLVMTGQMRREVSRAIRISGSGKRARGVMTGPRQLSIKRSNYPDLAGEITKVTQTEANELAKFAEKRMAARMNRDRTRTVERIRA